MGAADPLPSPAGAATVIEHAPPSTEPLVAGVPVEKSPLVAGVPVDKQPPTPTLPTGKSKEKVTTMIEYDINTVVFNETARQGVSTKVRLLG